MKTPLPLSLDYTIEDYRKVKRELAHIDGIIGMSERIVFPASLTDGIDELKLSGVGIDAENEDGVFGIGEKLTQGTFFKPGDEKILLTDEIARLFSLKPGDYVTIIARTKYRAINAIDLEIAGIIDTGNPAVDNMYFFIPLGLAQNFLDMQGMITEMAMMCPDISDASPAAGAIMNALPHGEYNVKTWEKMNEDLIRLYEMKKNSRFIMMLILFIMAAASVMNTMLMAIFERTAEIGTVMAMGFRKIQVVSLFMFEAMFLGIFGSGIGCIFGGGAAYYFKYHGIDISSIGYMSQGDINMPIGRYLYTDMSPEYIAGIFLVGIIIAVASGRVPGIQGRRNAADRRATLRITGLYIP